MSAAEKLGALVESDRREREVNKIGRGSVWLLNVEAVWDALPEIIAVVKAAEEIAEARDYWDWVSSFAPRTKVALSALDEALPQIGSTPPPEGATSP